MKIENIFKKKKKKVEKTDYIIIGLFSAIVILLGVLIISKIDFTKTKTETPKVAPFSEITTTVNSATGFYEVDIDNLKKLYELDEKFILYVGSPECHFCDAFYPLLNGTISEHGIQMYYFDSSTIASQEEYDVFISTIPYFSENDWGTPLLLSIENNEVMGSSMGAVPEESLLDFLKEESFIDDSVEVTGKYEEASVIDTDTEVADLGYTSIKIEEYTKLLDNSGISLIYIARPTCSYCVKFSPILKKVTEANGITINYVDTDSLNSTDMNTLLDSTDFLKNESWGTPLLIVLKNGEQVDQSIGYIEEEELTSFLKTNNFIKE